MIKAVLFDMDGTVIDTESVHKISWTRAADDFGIKFDQDTFYNLIGLNIKSTGDYFAEHYGVSAEQFEKILLNAENYSREHREQQGIAVKSGFIQLSDYLCEQGIRSVIVTSSTVSEAEHNLSNAGILQRFGVIVGGDSVKAGKPSPEPYLTAMKLLGLPAEQCIVAEDSANGVLSAVKAGLRTVYIKDLVDIPTEISATAKYKATALDEIISIIEEENKCRT